MGSCWGATEDRASLLPMPSTNYASVTVPSSSSYFGSSNTFIPKLVTINRSSVNSSTPIDINLIKEAQCRNLFEHLPLVNYNEKLIKQTDCAICLIDFISNEQVRQLPCIGSHVFHPTCIDGWLQKSLTCPQCSTNIDAALLLKFVPYLKNDDD